MDYSGLAFNEILKLIRKEKGFSQEKMAEILGTSKQALSRYERGERVPKINVAAKFAKALGMDFSELIGYEYNENGPTFAEAMDEAMLDKFTADDYHLLEYMYENERANLAIRNIVGMSEDDIELIVQMEKRLLGDSFIEYTEE